MTDNAKTMYYANQIIYRSARYEKRMRFSTDFLEYLRHSVADTIHYQHDGGDGNGIFCVHGKNFKKAKIVGTKKEYPEFDDKIKISEKLRKKHSHCVKEEEINDFKKQF